MYYIPVGRQTSCSIFVYGRVALESGPGTTKISYSGVGGRKEKLNRSIVNDAINASHQNTDKITAFLNDVPLQKQTIALNPAAALNTALLALP